jgi:hypothetical protein
MKQLCNSLLHKFRGDPTSLILDLARHTFGHVESMNLVAEAVVQEVPAQFRANRTARTLTFPLCFYLGSL